MGVILTGYVLVVIRAAMRALVVGVTLAGCGGSDHAPATAATAAAPEPKPIEAKRVIDAFLYAPLKPASVCPRLWIGTAKAQAQCSTELRRLKIARAHRLFAPPKRGTIQYGLGGVSGRTVEIQAGDRQPSPLKGRPTFYGNFKVRWTGGEWKIVSVETLP
jgi:hypothetical protein